MLSWGFEGSLSQLQTSDTDWFSGKCSWSLIYLLPLLPVPSALKRAADPPGQSVLSSLQSGDSASCRNQQWSFYTGIHLNLPGVSPVYARLRQFRRRFSRSRVYTRRQENLPAIGPGKQVMADFKASSFDIFQGNQNGRILLHPFLAKRMMSSLDSRQAFKSRVAFMPKVEKALHHARRERLSKTARSRKERHLVRSFSTSSQIRSAFQYVPAVLDQFIENIGSRPYSFQHIHRPPFKNAKTGWNESTQCKSRRPATVRRHSAAVFRHFTTPHESRGSFR